MNDNQREIEIIRNAIVKIDELGRIADSRKVIIERQEREIVLLKKALRRVTEDYRNALELI